jgi:hypothetical protein
VSIARERNTTKFSKAEFLSVKFTIRFEILTIALIVTDQTYQQFYIFIT